MRVALDTKILVYAEGVNPGINHVRSVELVMSLPTDSTFIPLQVLGEFANVLRRKTSRTSSAIQDTLDFWSSRFQVVETTLPVFNASQDLSSVHQFSTWDAIILSTAQSANCRLLLSEDLQDGFSWSGITIANPFAAKRHWLLENLLNGEVV